MDKQQALSLLFEDGVRDLTAEGYAKALSALRNQDPAAAKRVERALAPDLDILFPRRSKKWHETSQGLRARLALLPLNPHLKQDVVEVRDTLAIPPNVVTAPEGHPLWRQMEEVFSEPDPERVRRMVEGRMAKRWLHIHRRTALGKPIYQGPDVGMDGEPLAPDERKRVETEFKLFLSSQAHRSAERSAQLNLTADTVPAWLRKPPDGPEPYAAPKVPMEWATGRLVERHRLPWTDQFISG